MSKALKRLVALRERLKGAAEIALKQSHQTQALEEAAMNADVFAAQGGLNGPAAAATADWYVMAAEQRAASFQRLALLRGVIQEQQLALNHAKRDLKQVETLYERKRAELRERKERRELREQEDWVRARAHREKLS